jgi:hypothetical protein
MRRALPTIVLVVLLCACGDDGLVDPLPTNLPTLASLPSESVVAGGSEPPDGSTGRPTQPTASAAPSGSWKLSDDLVDRSARAVAASLSRQPTKKTIVLHEEFDGSDSAVPAFDLPSMSGGQSSMGTYEMSVNEPGLVALAGVEGLDEIGPDISLGVADTFRFLGGRTSDIAPGLYCWDGAPEADRAPDRTTSRYEMSLIPDGGQQRLVVIRRDHEADTDVLLIDERVAVPAGEAARMLLACRTAGNGAAQIIAGATVADDADPLTYVAAVDPHPLPAGGGAGLLMATRPGSRPGEAAVFGDLAIFDPKFFDVE